MNRTVRLWPILVLLAGCAGPPAPLPQPVPPAPPPIGGGPPQVTFEAVAFDRLDGWTADDLAQSLPALRASCGRLTQLAPSQTLGPSGLGGLAGDWLAPCGALRRVADADRLAVRAYFEEWFQPYRVKADGSSQGKFTGYFEPELRGSRQPDGRFKVPLYGLPPGQANDPPTFTRAEIEAGALKGRGLELLWVDDAIDAHILHIQGSGKVRMTDGSIVQVGYAGNNGRPFVGLGQILFDEGKLPSKGTMIEIRAWLEAHPAEAPALMAKNPRFVFFRLLTGPGPIGAEGVALTPGRSLAVDPRFIPLGVPLWLDTSDAFGRPFRRLMVAQDAGKAITGPIRGDVFWGSGDAAFDQAGRMKSSGTYYILLPRQRSGPVAALEGSTG
jgi:membrane-bound lytic murein transglycosylase A